MNKQTQDVDNIFLKKMLPLKGIMYFSILNFLSPIVSASPLSAKLDVLIEQQLPYAIVGVLVKDAQTGRVIYSRNTIKLLSPGSGSKLFTAAAALYQLKPEYQFLTSLSQKGQDFYITFGGSPSLTVDTLNKLIVKLKNQGQTTITGNIVLDGSRFKAPFYAGGNSYDDLGWYYTAPSTAIILNGNALPYDFISAKKPGQLIQVLPKTLGPGLTIVNQVITVNKEEEKHCNLNIDIQPNNTLRLFGCLAGNPGSQAMKLAITDPTLFAKQAIKNALNKNGVELKGQIISGKTPSDAQILVRFKSKNVMQLIRHMLQESDNLYADTLFKQLAYTVTGEGSYKQGAFAIKKILAQNTHVDIGQIELSDGAGGRYNLVTPLQIVTLLRDLYLNKEMHFISTLAQTGVSGTLKSRMQKSTLEKKVFAKTGTMHDVSSLSGYIINPPSKTLIFSIIINGINGSISTAKSLEEKILLTIAESEIRI